MHFKLLSLNRGTFKYKKNETIERMVTFFSIKNHTRITFEIPVITWNKCQLQSLCCSDLFICHVAKSVYAGFSRSLTTDAFNRFLIIMVLNCILNVYFWFYWSMVRRNKNATSGRMSSRIRRAITFNVFINWKSELLWKWGENPFLLRHLKVWCFFFQELWLNVFMSCTAYHFRY